jgi:hypothetical protein
VSVQLHTPATLPLVKEAPVPIEQEIGRAPELVCGHFGEEINLFALLRIKLQVPGHPDSDLVTILYAVQLWEGVKINFLTVQGGCIHGSPSICMGNVFLVLITTDEHCARRRPEALSPVRTFPMCRQFSSPMTSIRRSPMSTKHGCKKGL